MVALEFVVLTTSRQSLANALITGAQKHNDYRFKARHDSIERRPRQMIMIRIYMVKIFCFLSPSTSQIYRCVLLILHPTIIANTSINLDSEMININQTR